MTAPAAELVVASVDAGREPAAGPSLRDRMEYAKALAGSDLVPREYRGKPANVLLLMEYADALGIRYGTAFTSIYVTNAKPTMHAQLMAALVRSAGHRFRVSCADPDDRGLVAVAEVVRRDDPDFTFTARWDMRRAQDAGLLTKDNWQTHPAAMLKARATTEVCRDACPEVLAGIAYTPEEVESSTSPTTTLAAVGPVVRDGTDPVAFDSLSGVSDADPASPGQLSALWTHLSAGGHSKESGRAWCSRRVGREIGSSKELTRGEARRLIDTPLDAAGPPEVRKQLAAARQATTSPDAAPPVSSGFCPHGVADGNKPDPWKNDGTLLCPDCATVAASSDAASGRSTPERPADQHEEGPST
jgi:hypothetical protein